jgi:hypothetical protein
VDVSDINIEGTCCFLTSVPDAVQRQAGTLPGSPRQECIRTACPATIEEARQRVANHVHQYNNARLHSAIGCVTPADELKGLETQIFDGRDRQVEEARDRRPSSRQAPACGAVAGL